ncbi:CPBP family glutamic-type intramembrane protease [Asticcacaulis sp. DXS10W]|uniref:CPBP family glutamic-type intramembrane protease n=1 Tax=Asticcacaulis currens TaxID=2984210 RepID=A0ABT5IEN1_9CAUL|nr:CPBP family glutamic-type intramembrane protease [Asticcacaulis currens]MDC7693926.1 CPBP family glutamic-type intramembrane protease [Asticcacaulis currens]
MTPLRLIRERVTGAGRSLIVWPSPKDWAWCAGVSAAVTLTVAVIGFGSGILRVASPQAGLLGLWFSVMLVPAFSEELAFRGLMIPAQAETRRPVLWIGMATLIFVLWHVFEALVLLPGAGFFLQPAFLLNAWLIGLGCALMRWRTGSLWPAVLLHGALVFVWKAWLGGPSLEALTRAGS